MSGLQHKKPRIVWTNRPPRRPANGRHAMCDWPFPSTISCRLLMAPHRQKGRIVGQQFCPHKGMRIRTFCERRIAFRHSRPICELAKLEVPFLRSGDVYHCIRRIAFWWRNGWIITLHFEMVWDSSGLFCSFAIANIQCSNLLLNFQRPTRSARNVSYILETAPWKVSWSMHLDPFAVAARGLSPAIGCLVSCSLQRQGKILWRLFTVCNVVCQKHKDDLQYCQASLWMELHAVLEDLLHSPVNASGPHFLLLKAQIKWEAFGSDPHYDIASTWQFLHSGKQSM